MTNTVTLRNCLLSLIPAAAMSLGCMNTNDMGLAGNDDSGVDAVAQSGGSAGAPDATISASGGTPSSGGIASSGGTSASGGISSSGGTLASGGISSSGGTSSTGGVGSPLLAMLPADNEVGYWTRVGDPEVITDQTGLYNLIDGGAPKYIDRGWVSSAYATYSQGTPTIQVFIHDMGSAANAQAIYNFSLPASRQPIGGSSNAVVDLGLPTEYAGYGFFDRFYIEIHTSERSATALDALEHFMTYILGQNPTPVGPQPESISPVNAAFATAVGTRSDPIVFNLVNNGASVSGVLTTSLAGPNADQFAIADSTCVAPLAPLATCTVGVLFNPTSTGTKSATLTVTDATPGSLPITASLSGVVTASSNVAPDAGPVWTAPFAMLPASNEIGAWTLSADAQLVTDETGLMSLIDGASANYTDRGWVSGAYATYVQGAQTIQVVISDMGSSANAQSIYNAFLPTPSQALGALPSAVVDPSLSTAYVAHAYIVRYYIELNIDQRSATALAALQLFMTDIYSRASKL